MNTEKQNFRCDDEKWSRFRRHTEDMQAAGYRVDMSVILRAEVDLTISETVEQTAKRLGLELAQ